jgi:drug/metabolite transporter (DMT)-like permease
MDGGRRHEENVLAAAALEMPFGGFFLLIAGVLEREWAMLTFNPRTSAALLYLIFVGAIGGFSAYVYALKHLPVSVVSLYAYVNPIIAVILGVLLLREQFTWLMAAAGGIVLAGMAAVRQERADPLRPSHNPAPADEADEEQDNRDDQQDVDEVAQRVAAHHPEQPQHDQDDRDGF